jgi:hypothetical protein
VNRPESQDELRDYEKLTTTSEEFVYVAIDAPDGEAVGQLMRLFRQFRSWTLAIHAA